MNWIHGALATFAFEIKRSLNIQRLSVSAILIAFPPAILISILAAPQIVQLSEIPLEIFIILLVAVVCVLSLLLWATPNVYSELEGKSWSFVASRPGGRVANFLGKYFVSVFFSTVVSVSALTICVVLASRAIGLRNEFGFWLSMVGTFFIGCLVYSAVFSLMGTIFIKRAMVISAGYFGLVEVIGASLPAVLARFTGRFHLQSLGLAWNPQVPLPFRKGFYGNHYGMEPTTWFHLTCLATITIVCLVIGCLVIVNREYVTSDES